MKLLDLFPLLNEARHQWDTPEFKRWFRHSIVRDRRGNPARVFHGTYVKEFFGDIHEFDRRGAMKHLHREENSDAVGSWFSDRPDEHGAGMYIGNGGTQEEPYGTMYACYLRIENPWRPNSAEDYWNTFHKTAKSVEEFRTWLKQQGYDGIMFGPEVGVDRFGDAPGQRVWVALEPNQIKSAIGNQGGYSDSPNIVERREEIEVGRISMDVLYDPGASEMIGFLNRTIDGEARGLLVKEKSSSEYTLALWDAFKADHVEMSKALRRMGWDIRAGSHLEFSKENRGYGSRNITRSGLVRYGPIWGTNNRRFRDTMLAHRLLNMGKTS